MVLLDNIMVIKAVRRGVASDYRLTLRQLRCEARRRLTDLKKNLKQQLRVVDDEEKRKGKRKEE